MRCEDESRSRPLQPTLASFGVPDATNTAPKAYAMSPEDEVAPVALPRDCLRNPEAKSASIGEDYMGTSGLHARYESSSNPSVPAIASFLKDHKDSKIPRAIAQRSTLPVSQQGSGTGRSDFTPNDSLPALTRISSRFSQSVSDGMLPALTRISSRFSQSVSDGMGERRMTRNMRILVPDREGVLEPTTLPPFRRPDQDPILECPFTFIKCFRQFTVNDERAWIRHSLDHFRIDGRRPRIVDPPKVNSCCFCPRTFEALSGIDSWQERMDHVKVHHQYLGHRLAAARHDFALVEYFWQNGLLSTADYRALRPSAGAASRSAEGKPYPPD